MGVPWRLYVPLPIIFGLAAIAAITVTFTRSPDKEPTPAHVVAVFVDGLNNMDFRQACSTLNPHSFDHVLDCEAYFAGGEAQNASFGIAGKYRTVPHSAKVWTQTYKGRKVRLAVVKFRAGPRVLVSHLRFQHGRWIQWLIQ